MKQSLIAGAFCLSVTLAYGGPVEDFRNFVSSTNSARAEFSQTVFDSKGKATHQTTGEFAFIRPGQFRWQYNKPPQLVIGDGARVTFFDQDLNQVTVRKIEKAFSSTPAALLAGKSEFEAAFSVSNGGELNGMSWVVADPKTKDSGFEKIRLGFERNQLAAMELHDAFGNRTVITFSHFVPNAKIEKKEFQFVAPKGADILVE